MYEIQKGQLLSTNTRIIEVVPQIYTAEGMMLCLPSAFYPIDGLLIGMTPEYVLGGKFQAVAPGGIVLPATNAQMPSRMGFLIAVHEDGETMQPRTLKEIRDEMLMGTLAQGGI